MSTPPQSLSGQQPQPHGNLSPSNYMILVAFVAAIAGGLYGYDTGIISGALLQISRDFGLDHQAQELVTASILAGAVLGAVGSTRLSTRLGRRRTIMLVALLYIVGVLACAFAPTAFWLGAFRFMLGLAVGASTQIVPMYIAELAPPDKRGRLVAYFNVSIGIGILLAAVVGYVLQESWTWRWMIGAAAVPALILLLGMLWLPDSPRWLVETDQVPEARETLEQVRETSREVRREIAEIRAVQERLEDAPTGWAALRQPWLRPALIAGLGVAAFTQLSGIEMMIYYTPTFLAEAGFGHSSALLAALGVAITYLVMTFVGKLVVDHVGRRRLTLVTMPLAAIVLLTLAAVFRWQLGGEHHGGLVVTLLLLFMVFNSAGIQIIGWLVGSEIYPLSIRDQATGAHAAMLWGSNLLLTGTALSLVSILGVGGAMAFYGLLNVLGVLFIFFFVPETAGRSLEEIETSLRQGTFLKRSGR